MKRRRYTAESVTPPSLHHPGEDGAKMGSIFAPRLSPSPPKCGRRFGFAENGDSRVSCFTAPKGAYDILRTNQSVTEGVRLILPAICKENQCLKRKIISQRKPKNTNEVGFFGRDFTAT